MYQLQKLFSSQNRILFFGSLVIILSGGFVLSQYFLSPDKAGVNFFTGVKKSFLANSGTSSLVTASSGSSSEDFAPDVPDKSPSLISLPKNPNYLLASNSHLSYFAQKISEGGLEVVDLSQYSQGPKVEGLTPKDSKIIQDAKVIITGSNLPNQWIKDFYVSKEQEVVLGNGLDPAENQFWLDFVGLKKELLLLKDFLILKDASNTAVYNKNYDRLVLRIDGLNQKYKLKLAACTNRPLVENGLRFNQLTKQIGLNHDTIGIESLGKIEDAAKLELKRILTLNNTKTLFLTGYNTAQINVISTTLDGVKVLQLIDFADSKNSIDYFDMMDINLETIYIGLECNINQVASISIQK